LRISFKDNFVIWFNVAVAFILIIGYQYLGEALKYIAVPYVLYLVWSKDVRYFPALIVHIIPGSTISLLILTGCLFLTIYHFNHVKFHKIRWLIIISLLPLPIFYYMTLMRIFTLDKGFIDIVVPLGLYLGLFPFYYGVLISDQITIKIWRAIYLVLFFTSLLFFMPFINYYIRLFFFAFPLYLSVSFLIFNKRFRSFLKNYEIFIAVLIFIMTLFGGYMLTFTLLGSGFVGLFLAISYYKFRANIKLFTKPYRLILIFAILTALIIKSSSNYNFNVSDTYNPSMILSSNVLDYIQYKALGDRGHIWEGSWEYLKNKQMFWPPYELPKYNLEIKNTKTILTSIPVHNLMLELFRNYGFVIGGLVFFVYIVKISLSGRLLLIRNRDIYETLFTSTTLGVGFIGALTGQYPLIGTFSFLLLGVAGLLYGISKNIVT